MASQGQTDRMRALSRAWVELDTVQPTEGSQRYASRYATWRRLYEDFFQLEL
jgi:hypothetical protein